MAQTDRGAAYDHVAVESKWRMRWADDALYRTPVAGARPDQVLLPGLLPLSLGEWAERRARAQLCAQRRDRALLPHAGRAVLHPDGLGRLRAAGRERGRSSAASTPRDHDALRRQLPAPDDADGLLLRLGAGDQLQQRPSSTAGRNGSSCCCTAAGWPTAPPGRQWWCPGCKTVLANEQVDANGVCWRGHRGVYKRDTGAVVLPHHRLRRAVAGRSGDAGLAGAYRGDAAQLDRAQRGRGVRDGDRSGAGERHRGASRPSTRHARTPSPV